MPEEVKRQGKFFESLKRNNKQIRDDRAQAIGEEAQISFKRKIEDLELEQKRDQRDLDNMLDLSPDNAISLIVADKFDSNSFVSRQADKLTAMRNRGILIELLNDQYKLLFGEE